MRGRLKPETSLSGKQKQEVLVKHVKTSQHRLTLEPCTRTWCCWCCSGPWAYQRWCVCTAGFSQMVPKPGASLGRPGSSDMAWTSTGNPLEIPRKIKGRTHPWESEGEISGFWHSFSMLRLVVWHVWLRYDHTPMWGDNQSVDHGTYWHIGIHRLGCWGWYISRSQMCIASIYCRVLVLHLQVLLFRQ